MYSSNHYTGFVGSDYNHNHNHNNNNNSIHQYREGEVHSCAEEQQQTLENIGYGYRTTDFYANTGMYNPYGNCMYPPVHPENIPYNAAGQPTNVHNSCIQRGIQQQQQQQQQQEQQLEPIQVIMESNTNVRIKLEHSSDAIPRNPTTIKENKDKTKKNNNLNLIIDLTEDDDDEEEDDTTNIWIRGGVKNKKQEKDNNKEAEENSNNTYRDSDPTVTGRPIRKRSRPSHFGVYWLDETTTSRKKNNITTTNNNNNNNTEDKTTITDVPIKQEEDSEMYVTSSNTISTTNDTLEDDDPLLPESSSTLNEESVKSSSISSDVISSTGPHDPDETSFVTSSERSDDRCHEDPIPCNSSSSSSSPSLSNESVIDSTNTVTEVVSNSAGHSTGPHDPDETSLVTSSERSDDRRREDPVPCISSSSSSSLSLSNESVTDSTNTVTEVVSSSTGSRDDSDDRSGCTSTSRTASSRSSSSRRRHHRRCCDGRDSPISSSSLNGDSAADSSITTTTTDMISSTAAESSSHQHHDPDQVVSYPVRVKSEDGSYHIREAIEYRKYGDRVLVARQSPKGMLRLGGGNCTMNLYPLKSPHHPRFRHIGRRKAMAYDDFWQPFGPKYAGQTRAIVRKVPKNLEHKQEPFSVFMRRDKLGWEYCGDYCLADPEGEIVVYPAARDIPLRSKKKIMSDIRKSAMAAHGSWVEEVDEWRQRLNDALARDKSPAGPSWLIERRNPTDSEKKEQPLSLAARARALGYKTSKYMKAPKMARIMTHLDEFYEAIPINFVKYDEVMYDYVKEGETTRDSKGDLRTGNQPCAKANDWYRKWDQMTS